MRSGALTSRRSIARFRDRMDGLSYVLAASRTAIQPLIVGDAAAAVRLADGLWERGFWVPAIRPPTVPQGTARLRVSLSAAHAIADVDALTDALAALAPATADAGTR